MIKKKLYLEDTRLFEVALKELHALVHDYLHFLCVCFKMKKWGKKASLRKAEFIRIKRQSTNKMRKFIIEVKTIAF